jgi:hypothetical protein
MKENKPVIALLTGMDLTAQNVYRTGVDVLEKHFEVVVFDCRSLLQRPINQSIKVDPRFKRPYQVANANDLLCILENLNPAIAIDFIGPCREMKLIQPALRNSGCKFVIQKLGQLPQPNLFRRRINQFTTILKILLKYRFDGSSSKQGIRNVSSTNFVQTSNISKVRKIIDDHFETNYFEKADVALASGRQAIKSCTKLAHKTLSVKSWDVHQFAESTKIYNRDRLNGLAHEYAVFIDDALVHAGDWNLLGQESPITANDYFKQLNHFFSQIEKSHNVEVVIAGHPSVSNNPNYVSSFEGRSVYFGDTPNLVVGCKFAIVHGSAATSFAVMCKKPILVVSNSTLDKSFYGGSIRNMANALGVPVVKLEHGESGHIFSEISYNKYKRYINNLLYDRNCIEAEPWGEFLSFAPNMLKKN